MRNIFLVPRSNETSYSNFKSIIDDGVNYQEIEPYLDTEGKEILSSKKKVKIWGCTNSKKGHWNKIQFGDIALFYIQGVFRYSAKIVYKISNEELALKLWPRNENEDSWSNLFFIDEIKEIQIPLEELNKVTGYTLRFVQGFMRMTDSKTHQLLTAYGSLENFFDTKFEVKKRRKTNNLIEADIEELLSNIDKLDLSQKIHSLPTERPATIREIIDKVQGEWSIPDFQRYYDWKKNQIKELLESVVRDYYIGSLLLWEIKETPKIGIKTIEGVEKADITPRRIILDGQQRVTSLNYAINAPNIKLKDSKKPIYFYINLTRLMGEYSDNDLIIMDNRKFSDSESYFQLLFPLYRLNNYQIWLNGLRDYLLEKEYDTKKIIALIDFFSKKLRDIWEQYEVPYILLPKTLTLKEITEIFERINSKGKMLTVFDLLIARLLMYDIKLKSLWDSTLKEYNSISRYYKQTEKIPIMIFQSISMYYGHSNSAKRKDVLDISELIYLEDYSRNFEADWNDMSSYFDKAIRKVESVRSGYGVRKEKEVPFTPLLTILAPLMKYIEENIPEEKAKAYKKLDQFYWSVVFSNAFSQGVEGKLTLYYKEMIGWLNFDDKTPRLIKNVGPYFENINLYELTSSSSAIYKGILSIIGLEGAKDFATGLTFESSEVNNKDHLYPKSSLKSNPYRDSILNMTWMSDKTNKIIKKDKLPKVYLPYFRENINSEYELNSLLKSHLISSEAFVALKENNYDTFLRKREITIRDKINQLLDYKPNKTHKYDSEFISLISKGENKSLDEIPLEFDEGEFLEFKSTLVWNIKGNLKDRNIEDSVLKTIAGFNNKNGGLLFIGITDDNEVHGLKDDYTKGNLQNRDKFLLHLSNIIKDRLKLSQGYMVDIVKTSIIQIEDKDVCVVEVKRGTLPIFTKNEKFFVRNNNDTRELAPSEVSEYISKRF